MNAHFQNGIAERRIRELQEQARTMLIHANKRWPTTVNAYLWPYAIRMANDLYNATPDLKRKHTPIEAFSGTKVTMNPNHWSHFGCPVYVLDSDLQERKKINKWQYRARVGCYLGQSPQHARTVALVLSLTTGLVSPQFHVQMDTNFQTMKQSFGAIPPKSEWMAKCHFEKEQDTLTQKRKRSRGTEHNSTEQSNSIGTSTQQTQGVYTQPEQKLPDSGSHTTDLARSNGSNDHEAQTQFADEASPIKQVNDLTTQYPSGHKDMTYIYPEKNKISKCC